MTRLRAVLLATAALTAALALPASADGTPGVPADVSLSRGDVCVYVVQGGTPKGYCVRF